MTIINKSRRVLAALNLPHNAPALVAYASHLVKSMTGNASFPSPTPTLATLQAAIDALMAAQTAAQARTKGTAALAQTTVQFRYRGVTKGGAADWNPAVSFLVP